MKKILNLIALLWFTSACTIEQDYVFEKSGEVKMNLLVDMSALMKSMPDNGEPNKFGNIQDSIDSNNDLKDSMEYYGITDMNIDFDTNSYQLTSNFVFKDIKHFEKFMNKDRTEEMEKIKLDFSDKNFSLNNSLLPNEMLKGINNTQGQNEDEGQGEEEGQMDMSQFFSFKTTYHFPYEIDDFKSGSGNGQLNEDKKSITFENSLNDFTNEDYNGDVEVKFK